MKRPILLAGFFAIFAWYAQYGYQPESFRGYIELAQGDYYGYPMPGIIGLIKIGLALGSIDWFLLAVSTFAYAGTIFLFFKVFDLEPNLFYVPLFIPVAAIMSVKSNHALTPFIFMLSAYLFKREKIWASAVTASLAYWFRSELVLMPVIYGLVSRRWQYLAVPLVFIGIWFSITGQAGTTNNMAVFYIAQVNGDDGDAFKLADEYGTAYAWRPEAQSAFFWRSMSVIRSDKYMFVERSLYRMARVFLSRLFVAKEYFGGWISAAVAATVLILLWFPAFTRVRLSPVGVYVMTFALCQLPIAAFSGNTTITNATYLFLLGNAVKFYDNAIIEGHISQD